MNALVNMELSIARKSFIRVRDVRFVEFIARIESEKRQRQMLCALPHFGSQKENEYYIAMILANVGKFQDAAKLWAKCGYCIYPYYSF